MNNYQKLDQPGVVDVLFHPRKETKTTIPPHGVDRDVEVAESVVLGCRFHLHDRTSPTLLFFHGNGETVADYDSVAAQFHQVGLNFFVATYRGYGWSSGKPRVETMMADCGPLLADVQRMLQEMEATGPLFLMGRSLGSAAAIEMCVTNPDACKGLIIESGFADTLPLLHSLGCTATANLEEKDGFGNLAKIETIKLPTLVLHGAADEIIPVRQAERLQAFSGARNKSFFIIPGADHNTVMVRGGQHYFIAIKKFIDDVTGESSWRLRRKNFNK